MAASFAGSVFFLTSSQKLARFNSMCVVVSANVDENVGMSAELSEWK